MTVPDSQPVLLTASAIDIRLAGKTLLAEQELVLRAGERVGLVGRNGGGKSTLLKVLAGQEQFYTGSVTWPQASRVAFLPQELTLAGELTVRENVLTGAAEVLRLLQEYESASPDKDLHELETAIAARDGWNLESRLEMLLTALQAPPLDQIASTLSGGERRRVALAKVLIDLPEVLLLDEPTNHLDTDTIAWLEDFLRRSLCTCLLVTHDRFFLDQVATRILELAQGELYSHPGNYRDFLRRQAERWSEHEALEEKRLSFIRREIDWIRRGPKARGTKSRSRIQRFEDAVNQEALTREREVELLLPPPPRLGQLVVTLQQASLSLGNKTLFTGLNLEFVPGMRLGIIGGNGVGKTSLLKLIMGALPPNSGRVRIGERVVFNYADQHRVVLHDELTVYEEVGEGNDYVLFDGRKVNLWSYLKNYLFQDDEIHTKVGELSGGERNRLVLAILLKNGGNFLLLDEPTNDLDLPTLRILEEALQDFAGCLAVVSHDRYFLDRVCTHILAFEAQGVVCQPGDFTYYAQKKQARQEQENKLRQQKAGEKRKNASIIQVKGKRRLTWAEKREWEGMEEAIEGAEEKVRELESLFGLPDFHAKHGREAQELLQQLQNAKAEVERLYQRWEFLAELAEE